jgi:predicted Zn-dependent peptidase
VRNLSKSILICLFLPLSIFSQEIFKGVSQRIESNTKTVLFKNGLRLILVQRSESPTLAIYTKFLVGSVDEIPSQSGTAHLLEHMLFKGTPNVGSKDFGKEKKYQDQIEVWGSQLDQYKIQKRNHTEKSITPSKELEEKILTLARRLKNLQNLQDEFIIKNEDSYIYEQNGEVGFNAYTTSDVTNYQIQLPSNRLEVWAKMESDRLINPILREYFTERDVVIEERRMRTENSGASLLRERFLSLALEAHPYRMPVIGYPSVIPFLDIQETKKFFKENYHPGNMVITIVGKQDFSETERIVRQYFGSIPEGPKKKEIKSTEIQSQGLKRFEVRFPSGESMLMGWLKPSIPHPDNSVFDILDGILGRGPSSRLYKKLVLETNLCSAVNASNSFPGERYKNFFLISIRNNKNVDIQKIETIIWEELENIAKNGVSEDEIQKVKNGNIADFFRYMDSNEAMADSFGYYELLTGDWRNLFKVYENMNRVSSKDIQRVVQEYLGKDRVTIGVLKDSREDIKGN